MNSTRSIPSSRVKTTGFVQKARVRPHLLRNLQGSLAGGVSRPAEGLLAVDQQVHYHFHGTFQIFLTVFKGKAVLAVAGKRLDQELPALKP